MSSSMARSQFRQSVAAPALRAYLAEFLSTFLFVFAAVGSSMSASKATLDTMSGATPLVATAIAQGAALSAVVFLAGDVSGGHANPAVTFAFAVTGHIAVPTAMLYWASQLAAASLACFLLRAATAGQAVPVTAIAPEMTGFGAAVIEAAVTFGLVYTVMEARAKKGPAAAVGSLAVGMAAAGSVLAAGSFTGGSMNPARSFGPAIVSGQFKNQAVYWVGPLIGASLAGLVHHNVMCSSQASASSGSTHEVMGTVLV